MPTSLTIRRRHRICWPENTWMCIGLSFLSILAIHQRNVQFLLLLMKVVVMVRVMMSWQRKHQNTQLLSTDWAEFVALAHRIFQ